MEIKPKYIIVAIIYLALLIPVALIEHDVKPIPLLFLLMYGGITTAAFSLRFEKLATVLLYILLVLMLFIGIGLLTDWIIGVVDPNRGVVFDENGKPMGHVMDMTWIFDFLVSFISTPFIIFVYHQKKLRSRYIEISVCVLFTAITLFNYLGKL